MTEKSLQTIDIHQVLKLSPVIDEYALGDDFVLGEVSGARVEKSEAILDMLKYPIRFDGYIIFFLKKGHFTIDFNLDSYEIHDNSLLVNIPGNIIRLSGLQDGQLSDTEMVFVLCSREFLSNVRFDFKKAFQDTVQLLENPCITLSPEQLSIAEDYFRLALKIMRSPISNKKEVLGTFLTSLSYMIVDVWKDQVQSAERRQPGTVVRANRIFRQFLELVREYHNSERSVGFYADRICLSPKYLSKLIKQASGRSAPDWIDSYVILEAKNLLKYSRLSIKEIVYQLHFPNQSVFYKYFKSHTGMTPSEYRKS